MAFCENYIVIDSPDGTYVKTFEGVSETKTYEDVMNEVLYDAAEMICFSDCCEEVVREIYVGGTKIEYLGWQPDMLFEFCVNGRIIWSRRFPRWDH